MSALTYTLETSLEGNLPTIVNGATLTIPVTPPPSSVDGLLISALPTSNGAPTYAEPGSVVAPTLGTIPPIDFVTPDFDFPLAPAVVTNAFTESVLAFTLPSAPASPAISLPTPPAFSAISLPTAPTFTLPTFNDAVPAVSIAAPYVELGYVEQAYSSALLDTLHTKLRTELLTATTGIELDEPALWNRARERERNGGEAMLEVVEQRMGAMSNMLPASAITSNRAASAQRIRQHESSLERDIKLKHNDMAVANREFLLGAAANYEVTQQGFFTKSQARALMVARVAVDFAIRTFDARVTLFKLQLDQYKTAAAVFETRIRAAYASLELYRTQLAAARLSVEVQQLYADVYNAQLEGVQAYVSIYKTRMEAAGVAASIERLKLEGFQATVEAYTAQVNAKATEARAYQARVSGELAKVGGFQAAVDAYKAAVSAYRAKTQASSAVSQSEAAIAELQLSKYKTQIAEYEANLSSVRVRIKGYAELHRGAIKLSIAQNEAESERSLAIADFNEARATIATGIVALYSEYALGTGKLAVERSSITSREAINKANIANAEAIAKSRINSSEAISTAQIASTETITKQRIASEESTVNSRINNTETITKNRIAADEAVSQVRITSNKSIATARIASERAITGANISNAEVIAGARITSAEFITRANILNSGRIAQAQNAVAAFLSLNQTQASESIALAQIASASRASYTTLYASENTSVQQLNSSNNSAYSRYRSAVARSDANAKMAVLDLVVQNL